AFPLWHAFLALVARVGGIQPTQVMLHEPSAVAPVAFAVVYEAGLALFRSMWLGAAVLVTAVAAVALAPGHGGSFALLSQPGTLDRHVLVPAALTLFFLFLRHPGWALGVSLAALGVEILLVHTSTAVFLGIPLVGFLAARFLLSRNDLRSSTAALAALFVPAGAALAWLLPLVRETRSHSPSTGELERGLAKYGDELHVDSLHHYALRPEVVSRAGAVAVAGGTAVLSGFVGPFVLPLALGAGIALQLAYPGDFGPGLEQGGPAWATWLAAIGGAAAVAVALLRARRTEVRSWIVTAAAFL